MWDLAGDYEEKAMLSTAVSLGWSIGDFKQLTVAKIRDRLNLVRPEGFVVFETQRQKTGALTVGILNPSAIRDLAKYVEQVPPEQTRLWRILQ